jgi:hypothetical protein
MRAFLLAALFALPATAQPLRQVVVPADAVVAVPPRGAAQRVAPPPLAAPSGVHAQGEVVVLGGAPMGLGAAGLALLPLVGAAALGAGLAGGGGGGGAPASTR